jgi:hypothetical protein
MSNEEHRLAAVWLLLVSQRQIADLRFELAGLERVAAYWESEAVLRAVTIANDLALRVRQAELDASQMRGALRELARQDLTAETLRARLNALDLEI